VATLNIGQPFQTLRIAGDISRWSEKFSASNIDGNTIGKIFFPQVGTSFISIHVKLQVILSSSLFYTAV
jgi:hypothetical protein